MMIAMQSAPSSSVSFKCTMRVDEILQVTTETRPTTRYWFGTWKKYLPHGHCGRGVWLKRCFWMKSAIAGMSICKQNSDLMHQITGLNLRTMSHYTKRGTTKYDTQNKKNLSPRWPLQHGNVPDNLKLSVVQGGHLKPRKHSLASTEIFIRDVATL